MSGWMAGVLVIGFTAAALAADEKAATPAPAAAGGAPMPPGLALPPGGPMMQPGKGMPFPTPGAMGATNINPDTLRKVMQARSELDDLTRKLQARQTQLYQEDKRILELQAKMRVVQKEIDEILAKDEELAALRAKLDGMFNAPMPMPAPAVPPADAGKDAPAKPSDSKAAGKK
jgi:hypothetical protein